MLSEGYAIYPKVSINDNVDEIWLIGTEDLLTNRLAQSTAFKLASDNAKKNNLNCSFWYDKFIEKQCQM